MIWEARYGKEYVDGRVTRLSREEQVLTLTQRVRLGEMTAAQFERMSGFLDAERLGVACEVYSDRLYSERRREARELGLSVNDVGQEPVELDLGELLRPSAASLGCLTPRQVPPVAAVRFGHVCAGRGHLVPRDVPGGGRQPPTGHELPPAERRERDSHEHPRRCSLRGPSGGEGDASSSTRDTTGHASAAAPPEDARPGAADAGRHANQNGLFFEAARRAPGTEQPSSCACTRRCAAASGSSTVSFACSMGGPSRSTGAACSSSD